MPFMLEKIDGATWDEETKAAPYASPFHEYAWNELVAAHLEQDFQGYRASQGDQTWLIPMYEHNHVLRSSLIGYGGPLALHEVIDGTMELQASMGVLRELKTKLGASAIQGVLYPASYWPELAPSIEMAKTTVLDLELTSEEVFTQVISGNCRTAVRKAIRSGVKVRTLKADDDYDRMTALLNQTQRQVGSSYMTHRDLLHSISSLSEPAVKGETYVAELEDQPIALSTVVRNRCEAFHLFSGWDRNYANDCPVQALHWYSIAEAIKHGVPQYNMGESHTPGLLAAKLRWGGYNVTVPKLSL